MTITIHDRLVNLPVYLSDPDAARWCVFGDDKIPKKPWGGYCLWSDPTELSTLRDIADALASGTGHWWEGLGYALRAGETLTFLDWDDVRDPHTGDLDTEALAIPGTDGDTALDLIGRTYTEASVSLTGLHQLLSAGTSRLPAAGTFIFPGGARLELFTARRMAMLTLRRLDREPCDFGLRSATGWPECLAGPDVAANPLGLIRALAAARTPRPVTIDLADAGSLLEASQEWGRNTTLHRVATRLAARGLVDEVELAGELAALNTAHFVPPLPSREVDGIARSVARWATRTGLEPASEQHRTGSGDMGITTTSPGPCDMGITTTSGDDLVLRGAGAGDPDVVVITKEEEGTAARARGLDVVVIPKEKRLRKRKGRKPVPVAPGSLHRYAAETSDARKIIARREPLPRRCGAVTRYGAIGNRMIARRCLCGEYSCHFCAPRRLAVWMVHLLEEFRSRACEVWHQILTAEEYVRLGPTARKAMERRNQADDGDEPVASYRWFATGRGVEILSTHPFAPDAMSAPVLVPDAARRKVVLGALTDIRGPAKKRERRVGGSIEWSCPEIRNEEPSEEYEALGIGPNPDQAAKQLEELNEEMVLEDPEVDRTPDGRRTVAFHWRGSAELRTRERLLLAIELLKIRQPGSQREQEPALAAAGAARARDPWARYIED